jgi:flagellar biosynthesis/type III secretory pathway chaperone
LDFFFKNRISEFKKFNYYFFNTLNNRWITRKLKEKNETLKQEKLENKKWIARRRRSRKHQRLSQALEMAQQYGYNSTYYSQGFTY